MSGGWRGKLSLWGIFLAGFVLVASLHGLRGALDSGFGSGDDEAAHLVSGVMIHDYLAQLSPVNPVEYAKAYYTHYPKVAIGQWPPVYHLTQAVWTLLFGVSRMSLVLLGAALAAGVGALLFGALRSSRGPLVAASAALVFLLLPLVQHFSAMPGTEVLLALLSLAAVMAFGRFLDHGKLGAALSFALLSVLAILTKGNTLALALVPPLAIAVRRQWGVLRNPKLWGAASLVALLGGPWTLMFLEVNQSTWGGGSVGSSAYSLRAANFYVGQLVSAVGPLVLLLAAWGAYCRLRDREAPGIWSAAFAWCVAVLFFHIAVPSSIEARHLILLLPCLCLFAVEGACELVARLPQVAARVHAPVCAALFLGAFVACAWSFPRKDFHGFEQAVAFIREQPDYAGLPVLVDSGPVGEGLAVTEFVLADRRPDRYVVRATKFLSSSSWTGERYTEFYPDPQELDHALREVPINLVLFDRSIPELYQDLAHRATLERLLQGGAWRLVQAFDVQRGALSLAAGLELWERIDRPQRGPVRLDFARLVGREVPGIERGAPPRGEPSELMKANLSGAD